MKSKPGASKLTDLPTLKLAGASDLKKLGVGTALGTLGFPGGFDYVHSSLPDLAKRASATFKNGFVGRPTDYTLSRADFSRTRYVQHSALISGGTSGSPLFTSDGKVVGVNHGGRVIEFFRPDKTKKEGFKVERAPAPSAINWGIRIDEVLDWLRKQEQKNYATYRDKILAKEKAREKTEPKLLKEASLRLAVPEGTQGKEGAAEMKLELASKRGLYVVFAHSPIAGRVVLSLLHANRKLAVFIGAKKEMIPMVWKQPHQKKDLQWTDSGDKSYYLRLTGPPDTECDIQVYFFAR